MLITRIIVRIMEVDDRLLGWTETLAEARGDGCLWPSNGPHCSVLIEASGWANQVSLHWADVNVELRRPAPATEKRLEPGDIVTLTWADQPIFRVGEQANGLPPVTVRTPVRAEMQAGSLGAVGTG